MRTEIVTKYIADDGSVFYDEYSCLEYETNAAADLSDKLKGVYLKKLSESGLVPPSFSRDDKHLKRKFQYFQLMNKYDFDAVVNAVMQTRKIAAKLQVTLKEPQSYPNVLILELTQLKNMNEKNYRYSGNYVYLYESEYLLCTKFIDEIKKYEYGEYDDE